MKAKTTCKPKKAKRKETVKKRGTTANVKRKVTERPEEKPLCTEGNVDFTDPKQVAFVLEDHNLWRRGGGRYVWNVNPAKNNDPRFTSTTIGKAIDAAVMFLRGR